jgi:EAL domain-containing protein (putative c-di-GMP-specific phosphodiesterase class I)
MRVILDDFGTGYSALSCLHELPMTGLKLDRSLIANETRHPAILRAIVVLAEELGLTVTAEGIETIEQFEEMRKLGCDFGQGYLFARPLEAEAAGRMIRERPSWFTTVESAQSDL